MNVEGLLAAEKAAHRATLADLAAMRACLDRIRKAVA